MGGENKRIAVNTIIIYVKMIIVTIVGLFTTRYVLQGLGVSDYGLYNVVGGILAMLNIISTAMHVTTRRYINVEMGKPDGNMNKVFNISLILHIGFALLTLILAESIGLFYIYNYLVVEPGKLGDAVFVFEISTIVAVIGLINVPFQAVLNAHEKFITISVIDIAQVILKLPLIYLLIHYHGNALRFFAVGMCIINVIAFLCYNVICHINYRHIVKWKIYKDKPLYKEILVYNGYITTGAAVSVVKTQGSSMIANLFFGTIVNGALAIAYQVEKYVRMLAANLNTSSAPQITQSYSMGNYSRTQELAEGITKYLILIMAIMVSSLAGDLEFILTVWLGEIPEGALLFCQWILLSLFIRSFDPCVSTIMAAHGRLKETTITSTVLGLGYPVILYVLLKIGFPPQTVIILTALLEFVNKLIDLYILHRISHFNVPHYFKTVYPVAIIVGCLCGSYYYFRMQIGVLSIGGHLLSMLSSFLFSTLVCFFIGLNRKERAFIVERVIMFVNRKVLKKTA